MSKRRPPRPPRPSAPSPATPRLTAVPPRASAPRPVAPSRAQGPSPRASAPKVPRVVSLRDARLGRQLARYSERLARVLDANRRAVGQLYLSGVLFTRPGTRAGRDLLLAHEHLLRVTRLLERLADEGDVPAPRRHDEVDAVLAELDTLLERTDELTRHTTELLGELKRP